MVPFYNMTLYALISFILFLIAGRLAWKINKATELVDQLIEEEV